MVQASVPEASPARARRGSRRLRRWLPRIAALLGVGTAVLWWAVHRFDWMGPLVANSLRAVIGVDAVAKLEDFVYGLEDTKNRLFRGSEAPQAYWSAAPLPVPPPPPPAESSAGAAPALSPFRPKDPGAALKSWAAKGDGVWVPIVDPRRPGEQPHMMKTLLHPDPERGWAEVFVVAIDLRRVTLKIVAGKREPAADNPAAEKMERPAVIPEADHDELLAAFNGGFMTEHGGYGFKLGPLTVVAPIDKACTLAAYDDGSLRVAPWPDLKADEPRMTWLRQAPECMVHDSKFHPGILYVSGNRKWGATLDGETVIRRSGIGLNAGRDILYVAISNHTNAKVFAKGMHHAGAVTVAQLDVNWSYPKFVLFEAKTPGGPRKAVPLASGFEFSEDEYIRQKARRDFFYLVRKPGG